MKILVLVVAFLPVIHLAAIRGGGVSSTVTAINVVMVATAITVAMLRDHLFDIDTVIRRTVTYTAVTALLAGVYLLGVVTLAPLAGLLTGGYDSDLVVVASTLAVAALFNPVRRRVHHLVSRHFQRSAYDPARILEDLTQRLRHDGELDLFAGELRSTVASVLQPAALSIWVPSSTPDTTRPPTDTRRGATRWLSTTS